MKMNKKGFTLMELLIVILIVSVVSVGAIISFGQVDDTAAKKERANQYAEIQRAASLYLDLHDALLKQFVSDQNTMIKLYTLQEEGYISRDLEDPVTTKEIDNSYSVILYVDTHELDGKEVQNVNSCIVDTTANITDDHCGARGEYYKCIANIFGNNENEYINYVKNGSTVTELDKTLACPCECLKKAK